MSCGTSPHHTPWESQKVRSHQLAGCWFGGNTHNACRANGLVMNPWPWTYETPKRKSSAYRVCISEELQLNCALSSRCQPFIYQMKISSNDKHECQVYDTRNGCEDVTTVSGILKTLQYNKCRSSNETCLFRQNTLCLRYERFILQCNSNFKVSGVAGMKMSQFFT